MENEKRRFQLNSNWLPQGICGRCLEDSKLTRGSAELIVSYCPHNRTLGMLAIRDGKPSGPWRMISPVEIGEVNAILERGGDIIGDFLNNRISADSGQSLEAMPDEAFFRS